MAAPEEEPDLAALIAAAHRAAAIRVAETLRKAGHEGVAPSWLQVFRGLASGRLTLTALAEGMGVTKQTASAVVDAMEAAGHLERLASLADRRAKLIVLTDRGRDAAAAAARAGRELERIVAAETGPEGVDVVRRALGAVAGGAIRPGAPGGPRR